MVKLLTDLGKNAENLFSVRVFSVLFLALFPVFPLFFMFVLRFPKYSFLMRFWNAVCSNSRVKSDEYFVILAMRKPVGCGNSAASDAFRGVGKGGGDGGRKIDSPIVMDIDACRSREAGPDLLYLFLIRYVCRLTNPAPRSRFVNLPAIYAIVSRSPRAPPDRPRQISNILPCSAESLIPLWALITGVFLAPL